MKRTVPYRGVLTPAQAAAAIQAMIAQQDRMATASERLVQSLIGEVFG